MDLALSRMGKSCWVCSLGSVKQMSAEVRALALQMHAKSFVLLHAPSQAMPGLLNLNVRAMSLCLLVWQLSEKIMASTQLWS